MTLRFHYDDTWDCGIAVKPRPAPIVQQLKRLTRKARAFPGSIELPKVC
jgi:hypothetical protein